MSETRVNEFSMGVGKLSPWRFGPDQNLADLVRRYLAATGDPRKVVADPDAAYFGVKLDDKSLTPGTTVQLGTIRFEDWMAAKAA